MKSLSNSENCEVVRWCREGMLYEVEAWLQAGHAISTRGDKMRSPLALAAGRGFQSLVKLLLDRVAWPQRCLDAALGRAVAGGHNETAKLLLARGACIGDVVAKELVVCGNPDVVSLLVEKGVDIETGYPLAHAIAREVPGAVALLRHGRKKLETVRLQGAIALRYCVMNNEEHRVTRLIHAGANSRLEAPCLNDYARRWHRYKSSAMWEAFCTGSFRMFIRMGAGKRDDLQDYLNSSSLCKFDWAIMQLLIRRGAKINDQPAGGSTVIDSCMWHRGEFAHYGLCREGSENAFLALGKLAELGGRWVPDQNRINRSRNALRKLGSREWLDLARLLVERHVAAPDVVWKLCDTKGVRERLGDENWKAVAVLCGREVRPRKRRAQLKRW